MISVTKSAVGRFRNLLEENGTSDHGIRIFASGGG